MRVLGWIFAGAALLASMLPTVSAHARLTVPSTRPYTYSGGSNAPAWTCNGPVFGTSSTSMRCHDVTQSSSITSVAAGSDLEVQWIMEANHPGDCSVWLSYDQDWATPVNWIKLKDFPGCLANDGLGPPNGNVKIRIPANLPPCDHCVLRWEWYGVQQVNNVEFYVNCADIKITNGNPSCPKPGPTTAISGIDHLGKNYHSGYNGADKNTACPFYNPYNGNFDQLRSRGPLEWVPPASCSGGNPTNPPQPTTSAPVGTTAGPGVTTTTSAPPVSGGKGGIVNSAGAKWDGSFSKWDSNNGAFCNCQFGVGCTYICAGGGDQGGGGGCPASACTSGQYSFSAADGWTIKVNKGASPQRAFAYAPFCAENSKNSACLSPGAVFTMSFRFDNVKTWGGYIKILFFGDGNDVLGLWPNKGMKLVAWPNGDLPQSWAADLTLLEGVWYDVTITINNFDGGMNLAIRENGATLYSGGAWNNTKVSAQNRAQVGVYTWAPDGPQFTLKLRNLCAGTAEQCKFTYDSTPTPTCPADGIWPSTSAGVMVMRPCPAGQTGVKNQQRTCGNDGTWGVIETDCKGTPAVTTTPPPPVNPCAGVDCGANGMCSTANGGKCVCYNGYTGTNCGTAPPMSCNINCAALNRDTCTSSNVCGNCLTGYSPSGSLTNTLCQASCPSNCDSLNRLSCSAPGVCGACKSGFNEPSSQSRTQACTAQPQNTGNYQFSVMAQWETGFCGSVKIKCPFDGRVSFTVPSSISTTSNWNIVGFQQIGSTITGGCPSWAGGNFFDAGFCANKLASAAISANTNGYSSGTSTSGINIQTKEALDVSLTVVLNNADVAAVTPTFATSSAQEISLALNLGGGSVSLQSYTSSNNKLYLTYKVSATTTAERDAALSMSSLSNVAGYSVAADESSAAVIPEDTGATSDAFMAGLSPMILIVSMIASFFAYGL